MLDAVNRYAPMAKAVIAAGTCAAFGGIGAAPPNRAGCKAVKGVLADTAKLVNLPGCPVHSTALVQTLLDVILSGLPPRDAELRPTKYYGSSIHRACERLGQNQARMGQPGCYLRVGCNGPRTSANVCPAQKWNGGTAWCIGVNMPCLGCSRPEFPVNPLLPVR